MSAKRWERIADGAVAVLTGLRVGDPDAPGIAEVSAILGGTARINPGTVSTETRKGTTFAIPGAEVGDLLVATPPAELSDDLLYVGAAVPSAGQGVVYVYNPTATDVDDGQTTTTLARNAAGATVDSALEALEPIGVGNVAVVRTGAGTQAAPFVYTAIFGGDLADTDVLELTADGSLLTASAVDISVVFNGTGGTPEVQDVMLTDGPTGGTFTLTFSGDTTTDLTFDATAQAVEDALNALASIIALGSPGTVGVARSGAGTQADPYLYLVTFGQNGDVAQMTGTGTNLTASTVTIATAAEGGGGADEVQDVTLTDGPTGGTFTLSLVTHAWTWLLVDLTP